MHNSQSPQGLKPASPLMNRFGRSLLIAAAGGLITATSAIADTLSTWRFDAQQNQLEFATDQSVQPVAQLVPNPDRVVIDLPGIRLKRPKIDQPVGGTIKSVRIGQFNASTTRLVVELAPGYRVDPQQVKVTPSSAMRWSVKLPQPTLVNASPEVTPGATSDQPIAIAVPPAPADSFGDLVPQGASLTWLYDRLVSLNTGKFASLRPGMYILDLDTGNHINIGGDRNVPTASVIKLPILVAFFQDVDAGKIRLDETLTITRDVKAGGSGFMQDRPIGSKYTALQTVTNMIIVSDNTATNMIIKRMGGFNAVNSRFRSWGLTNTVVRNWLPDLGATNRTTARELVTLMAMLETGKLLTPNSRKQAIDILQRVKNKRLLPAGLGSGASIAHKTGYIRSVLGDAGIIYMPNGKRYLAAVLVENNSIPSVARVYIQQVSRIVYSYMLESSNQPTAALSQNANLQTDAAIQIDEAAVADD